MALITLHGATVVDIKFHIKKAKCVYDTGNCRIAAQHLNVGNPKCNSFFFKPFFFLHYFVLHYRLMWFTHTHLHTLINTDKVTSYQMLEREICISSTVHSIRRSKNNNYNTREERKR